MKSSPILDDGKWHWLEVQRWGNHLLYSIDGQTCDGSGFNAYAGQSRALRSSEVWVRVRWRQRHASPRGGLNLAFSREVEWDAGEHIP